MRLGISPYINVMPLTRGLDQQPGVEVVTASPARLADLLRQNKLDAAFTSSSEYFNGDYRIVPVCALSSRGQGADSALFSKVPLQHIYSVAMDEESRSTNLLLRLLMHRLRPGAGISYVFRPQDDYRSLRDFDACLLIGNRALRECGHAEYRFDLGEMWREHTGMPMVYTLWLTRPGAEKRLWQVLGDARRRGEEELDEVTSEASIILEMDYETLKWYFTKSIDYSWTVQHERSLDQFGRELYRLGLVRHERRIEYLESAENNTDPGGEVELATH